MPPRLVKFYQCKLEFFFSREGFCVFSERATKTTHAFRLIIKDRYKTLFHDATPRFSMRTELVNILEKEL